LVKANKRDNEMSQNYGELCTNGKLDERIGILFESHSEAENCGGFRSTAWAYWLLVTGQLVRITSSLCIVYVIMGCLL
jgi:hypothetical protein